MMIAEHRASGDQFVARDGDRALNLGSPLVGRRDLPLDPGDLREHGRAVKNRERLGDDELAGNAKQSVEHTGSAVGGIFADRDHRAEAGVFLGSASPLHRLAAEGDAHSRQVTIETHSRQQHRARLAGVQQGTQEFAGLGINGAFARDDFQHPCAVGREVVDEIGGRFRQFPESLPVHVLDVNACGLAKDTRQIVGESDSALKPSSDDGEIEVVDEHPLVAEPLTIPTVDHRGERVVEGSPDFGLNLAPDDVRIDGEAAVVHRADQRIARGKPLIDLALVGCLKAKPVELDGGHEKAVLRANRLFVDMPEIRHMRRDGFFARGDLPKTEYGGERRLNHQAIPELASSGRIGIAAPEAPVACHRTSAEAGQNDVDESGVANGQPIGDGVDRDDQQKHQEVLRVDEDEDDEAKLDDEQNVGDARHHGRAREAPDQGIEVRTLVDFHYVNPRSTCLRTTT